MVEKISVKNSPTIKRTPKTKIRTVTVVNPHYIGNVRINEAFEQALAINAHIKDASRKTTG